MYHSLMHMQGGTDNRLEVALACARMPHLDWQDACKPSIVENQVQQGCK